MLSCMPYTVETNQMIPTKYKRSAYAKKRLFSRVYVIVEKQNDLFT